MRSALSRFVSALKDSRKNPEPVVGWESAFKDSRKRGHQTDAYTFQIAWAYAQQHFESTASRTSDVGDDKS